MGRCLAEEAEGPDFIGFLDLLARDIEGHPERLLPTPLGLLEHAHELVRGVIFDLDAAL